MICVICQDELCDNRSHELPECGHYFHANCIISWFRAGHKQCPICRDNGISQTVNRYRNRKHRIAYFKKWAHIKKIPGVIQDLVDKLKKEEIKMKEIKKQFTILSQGKEQFTYKQMKMKTKRFRTKLLTCDQNIFELRKEIGDFPITPIVICKRKTIYANVEH
tara:strand:+ start:95 stop:583 length:489 start_codon:yes stop_codon:yes gene_type:complete